MNRDVWFTFLFMVLLGIHVYSGQWGILSVEHGDIFWLIAQLSKPTLLLTLIFWLLMESSQSWSTQFFKWILAGLFFSLGGDVVLIFQELDGQYFVLGLSSFLLAHLAYIWAFTKTYRNDHEVSLLRQQGWLLVLIVGYAVYFFSRISPSLGGFIAPVMAYTVVIAVMALLAFNRYGKVSSRSFWWVAIGAILFTISDSILAWNKFVDKHTYGHALIMATYGIAQFCIVKGALQQLREVARARIH